MCALLAMLALYPAIVIVLVGEAFVVVFGGFVIRARAVATVLNIAIERRDAWAGARVQAIGAELCLTIPDGTSCHPASAEGAQEIFRLLETLPTAVHRPPTLRRIIQGLDSYLVSLSYRLQTDGAEVPIAAREQVNDLVAGVENLRLMLDPPASKLRR